MAIFDEQEAGVRFLFSKSATCLNEENVIHSLFIRRFLCRYKFIARQHRKLSANQM
jgi:hypothetical protein